MDFFFILTYLGLRSAFGLHDTDIHLESTLFKYYASIHIEM
jgi:hypothetical protein